LLYRVLYSVQKGRIRKVFRSLYRHSMIYKVRKNY